MFSGDKDKLWMAYLDGQLSAAEALAFEESLSPEERARLAQELRLERGLAECLSNTRTCPDAVWQQTAAALGKARSRPLLLRRRVLLSVAAGLAALFLIVLRPQSAQLLQAEPDEPILTIADTCMNKFAGRSSTEASQAAVQDFLEQRGVTLNFVGMAEMASRHQVRLLGASERGCHGNPVMEIMFACCNKPVKVVIARRGSRPAVILQNAAEVKSVRQVEELGNYVCAVVAHHRTPDLLELFRQQPQPPARDFL